MVKRYQSGNKKKDRQRNGQKKKENNRGRRAHILFMLFVLFILGSSLPPVVCRRADVLFVRLYFQFCRRAHVLFVRLYLQFFVGGPVYCFFVFFSSCL